MMQKIPIVIILIFKGSLGFSQTNFTLRTDSVILKDS